MNSSGHSPAGSQASDAWQWSRSFWSDVYRPLPIELRAREPVLALIQLENSLLRRLVRLQAAELRLRREVNRRRGLAGRRAIRQIERDRQRLGRDLHTGVGQLLATIRIQLEVIAAQMPYPAQPVQQALDRIAALAFEALDQVRGVSRRLQPPEWQQLSLEEALRQLWETSGVAQRFAGAVSVDPLPVDPEPEVKAVIYRGAQEALSNIIRHAKATRVDLSLSAGEGRLLLSIQDDGVGFDSKLALSSRPDLSAGIGLRAIREQADELGGKLMVRSGPLGTTLEVSVPLVC